MTTPRSRPGAWPPATLASLLFLLLLLTGAAAAPAKRPFDLPADSADRSLKRFSLQSGIEVVFATQATEGVRTVAVKGEYAPLEALDRLLAGTTLVARPDPRTGAIVVSRGAADPNVRRAAADETDRPTPGPATATSVPGPAPEAGARVPATGAIEGRVLNAGSARFLTNARITIVGTHLEAYSDDYGFYRLAGVPAQPVMVRVFFTGLPPITQEVTVSAGQTTTHDFQFGEVLLLNAFTVAAQRDTNASSIAVNEQRFASAIKSVVSTDTFGDIAEGNVGDFVKFIPGVTVDYNGGDARGISVGGMPPLLGMTPITVDGNQLASASSSNASRLVELDQVSISNMARVEVTRSQNPDSPAAAIGGSVNLVSKSAFEYLRPQYLARAYLAARYNHVAPITLDKTPGPFRHPDYKIHPNLELNAIVPVSKRFGFSLSGLHSVSDASSYNATPTWVPQTLAPTANYPATDFSRPYLARYNFNDAPKVNHRESLGVTADYRFSDADSVSIGLQYSYYLAEFGGRTLNFDVGRVASFSPSFTQGAAGAGFVQMSTTQREKSGTTVMPTVRYRHLGRVWQSELSAAYSRASNHYRDIDKGYWQSQTASLRNVTVRFDNPGRDRPETITVLDGTGAPVDPYRLSNYNLENGQTSTADSVDIVRSFRANTKRTFGGRVPVTVKAGADVQAQTRDRLNRTSAWTFSGAGANAAQWPDDSFSQRSSPWGFPRVQWYSPYLIAEMARARPELFVFNETSQVNAHRALVTSSQRITETIWAPYLRFDTRFLRDRLSITGGVRYERTEDDAVGGLVDASRIYQRDAAGNIVRDAAGRPVAAAPLASLAGTQRAYVLRGITTEKDYGDFYPSLNLAYNLTDRVIARVSYARSIARPEFSNILPSISLPDETAANRTIVLTNPNLEPWSADSYGLSLEYYFAEASAGVFSVRGYRRDIANFWGAIVGPVTNDVLASYGLDPAVYGASQGYMMNTRTNAGDARITGIEFDYRQNLTFLPSWAPSTTVFANMTLQHLVGSTTADFSGFVPKTISYGAAFSRERFTARVNVNLRGRERLAPFTGVGVEPGTYTYKNPRTYIDITTEVRLTRSIALFANVRNLLRVYDDTTMRYGPATPDYAKISLRQDFGALYTAGVKGTF